jgi:hypothetical protein
MWQQTRICRISRHASHDVNVVIHFLPVGFEVLTAAVMNVDVFWDIKTQFVPLRRHITSLLQSPAG